MQAVPPALPLAVHPYPSPHRGAARGAAWGSQNFLPRKSLSRKSLSRKFLPRKFLLRKFLHGARAGAGRARGTQGVAARLHRRLRRRRRGVRGRAPRLLRNRRQHGHALPRVAQVRRDRRRLPRALRRALPVPPSRTNWTRLVPPSRNNWTRLVPSSRTNWTRLTAAASGAKQKNHPPPFSGPSLPLWPRRAARWCGSAAPLRMTACGDNSVWRLACGCGG